MSTPAPNLANELLYQCRDSDRFLYHYTCAFKMLRYILRGRRLKLGQYSGTNDPKESKEWQFHASAHDGAKYDLANYPLEDLSARMNAGLKHGANVLCLSRDGSLTGNHMVDIYHRGFCRPRMWAQYADNHQGVCLVFEREKLERAIRAVFPKPRPVYLGPVSYLNRGIVPDFSNREDISYVVIIDAMEQLGWPAYIREHLARSYKRLFFEKNADWAQENEFRWVVFGGRGEDEFFDYKDALRGIMFGASATRETIYRVIRACEGQTMWFQQLEWKGCAPWYTIGRDLEWEAAHASVTTRVRAHLAEARDVFGTVMSNAFRSIVMVLSEVWLVERWFVRTRSSPVVPMRWRYLAAAATLVFIVILTWAWLRRG